MYPVLVDQSKVEKVPTSAQMNATDILKRADISSAGLLCIRSGGAAVVDPVSGKTISSFSVNRNLQAGQTLMTDSTCAVLDENKVIQVVDLPTGKTITEIPVQAKTSGSANAITGSADGKNYYYCDRGGLYRVTESKTELVMSGAGTALSELSISNLFQLSDGSFLMLGFENDRADRNKNDNRVMYHVSP